MKFFRFLLFSGCFFVFSIAALAADATSAKAASTPTTPVPLPVLPTDFGGWQIKGSVTTNTDPAAADATNAAVLKEYGFERFEKAIYTSPDGRTLTIKAAVFGDASGAYGAFTFYDSDEMREETIGAEASYLNNRVLFYQGNVLIDAMFDRMSVMSAAQLRVLAGLLPQVAGNRGNLPSLPSHLPKRAEFPILQKHTTKYVLGPTALDKLRSPLPLAMVDFKSGAEVVIGKYTANAGDTTLMLIEYPTPQIAAEKLRQIEASHSVAQQQPGVATIVDVGPFFDSRTGPILVIASGPLSKSEARALMGSVSYDADVTWNENTYVSKKDNLANFLYSAIILCGVVVGLMLVAGVAFGGLRLAIKRFFPDSIFDRPETVEFIALHLEETPGSRSRER
jgi:hypothetical protein